VKRDRGKGRGEIRKGEDRGRRLGREGQREGRARKGERRTSHQRPHASYQSHKLRFHGRCIGCAAEGD